MYGFRDQRLLMLGADDIGAHGCPHHWPREQPFPSYRARIVVGAQVLHALQMGGLRAILERRRGTLFPLQADLLFLALSTVW